ncbi:MAG: calcium/sodium antiporter [Acidimicrobiales bacterium]|jgi:cation:H+ antiporter
MLLGLVFALAGLAVLAVAADHFVRGAARIAVARKVSPVVIGAVLIGFGTSAPEMVVSGLAAGRGDLDIGVGNIVGSNVANISLVLAAAATVAVVPVSSSTVKREVPISLASVIVFALLIQGEITRLEGALLALLIAIFLAVILRAGASGDVSFDDDVSNIVGDEPLHFRYELLRTINGLVGVVVASWFIVDGAERVAEALELSGGFVGFTLVALGTSAPELVTSVQAARQGETDLLVGNLLGSNVFNSLAVGGIIGLIGPGPIVDTTMAQTGSVLMVGIVLVSAVFMVVGGKVDRPKAFVLFFLWVVSVVVLSGGESVQSTALGF